MPTFVCRTWKIIAYWPEHMASRVWKLKVRLNELRRHMLPASFAPLGNYSDRQFDRVRAYIVLAHAEIEACMEDVAKETIDTAVSLWVADGKPRRAVLSLLAYYDAPATKPPSSFDPTKNFMRLRIEEARAAFKRRVDANNGIKEGDVLKLFFPVGITESDLDQLWLNTVNSFGNTRGGHAHTAARTEARPDPSSTLKEVALIVAGLESLATKLVTLAR